MIYIFAISSQSGIYAWEWALNEAYNNIINGRNLFKTSSAILYPFGTDYLATDSGNAILFIFLRPFLSVHQSLSVIVAGGLFAANIGMYLLLRKLRTQKITAFIISAMYGYMTFLMPRLGHLNYLAIYTFPWFYFGLVSCFSSKTSKQKILYAIVTGFFFTATFYINAYYFIALLASLVSLSVYFLAVRKSKIFSDILEHRFELFIACISIAVFIFPWVEQTYKTRLFEGLPKTEGWGGAIQFSSDLFGYFVPSIYSYFLHSIVGFWGAHFKFARAIFEEFSYPGITILTTYIFLVFLFVKKKLTPVFTGKNIAVFNNKYCFVGIDSWSLFACVRQMGIDRR